MTSINVTKNQQNRIKSSVPMHDTSFREDHGHVPPPQPYFHQSSMTTSNVPVQDAAPPPVPMTQRHAPATHQHNGHSRSPAQRTLTSAVCGQSPIHREGRSNYWPTYNARPFTVFEEKPWQRRRWCRLGSRERVVVFWWKDAMRLRRKNEDACLS